VYCYCFSVVAPYRSTARRCSNVSATARRFASQSLYLSQGMTILPRFVVKLRPTPGCVGLALDFGQPSLRMSLDAKKPSMLMSFAFSWFSSFSNRSSVACQLALNRLYRRA
jgi:hypothetical protein